MTRIQTAIRFGFVAGLCLVGLAQLAPGGDGAVAKAVLKADLAGENLVKPDAWRPFDKGFVRDGQIFLCDNADATNAVRGVTQSIELNQTRPEPIVASAWSKAAGISGGSDADYAVYLDLTYQDNTPLWGQKSAFAVGTHDWERRQVVVLPEKPVKRLSFHLLFRKHGGKAWFRDPELRVIRTPEGFASFDGIPVRPQVPAQEGFQIRDVAAGTDFVRIEREALGMKLQSKRTPAGDDAEFCDVTLSESTGKDRATTLFYTVPVAAQGAAWCENPRRDMPVETGREYVNAARFQVGTGRLSYYPLAAVISGGKGYALGIDMSRPAFFRIGYNAATGELFLAYDLGFAPEKPAAKVRLCRFTFDPKWGFRGALARYYELFPEQFRCRTPRQGLWMPFAKISRVQGWEDFGFKFKEGNDEPAWDDAHDIITFRYTEPMTWWMRMPKEMPRTMEAAEAEARRLAGEKKDPAAKALLASGYHNASGKFAARLLDTPWCNGAVWSMNSMPGIAGDMTHFKLHWNEKLRAQLYGPNRKGDLDGEYIDSSEGYVTDELDFRRAHFAAAQTPLSFCPESRRPAIFRGLITFEYVRAIADDVHGMGKLMMANSTPIRLCWLAPLLEVMGTETDWHRKGQWRPMTDADLLYRRSLCRGKPYCFLMNTVFEEFSHELVEKYMKRSLAYGMFPGFFSHNASQGHYFTRPELYNRDRPLFKKYVPLCKQVAEAGWEPVTQFRSDDEKVYVERFGTRYLTVFNDGPARKTVTITADGAKPVRGRELLSGRAVRWENGRTTLSLESEDVAVIELQ